jgi:hypothetical protein
VDVEPAHLLRQYWGPTGHFCPVVDVFLRGPNDVVLARRAVIDTGSPYNVFDAETAAKLGLRPPFRRRVEATGVGGQPVDLTFPDDSTVRLLLSDFVNGYIVWAPLVGFVSPGKAARRKKEKATAVLGFTGFLQHLDVTFTSGTQPAIEISVPGSFPGVVGTGRPPGNVWTLTPPG